MSGVQTTMLRSRAGIGSNIDRHGSGTDLNTAAGAPGMLLGPDLKADQFFASPCDLW